MALTANALTVLERRYLRKDAAGAALETPEGMFRRVARAVAEAERLYRAAEAERWEEQFFAAMTALRFLPNSPTLMNAGTPMGQLAACFVLPVGDSIPEIFASVRDMALIHQSGGGTGFSFSRLRPEGDVVHETGGVASGPISFMRVFDTATEVVKQGGRRRGANMGVLSVDHPDILAFARAKLDPATLTNFNLSVAIPDRFMAAVEAGLGWSLVNPRTGQASGTIDARDLWQDLCSAAWQTGDPGLLFIDEINRHNPTPALGQIEATNPCGEQPLLPYESCTLGSINLARLAASGTFDWEELDRLTRLGVRFLDDVIDTGRYPLPEIEAATKATRKIGLGVMGLAEALIAMGLAYDSDDAVVFASSVMRRLNDTAHDESVRLAEQRGSFPSVAVSTWPGRGIQAIRNAAVTTVAPTGTLSIIAGTSSGIEPLFAVAFRRMVLDGEELTEVSPQFVAALANRGLPVAALVEQAARTGSVQAIAELPEEIRRLFRTALDITPSWHIRMQAAFQEHTDGGVSKTVNLPADATVDDVRAAFERAWGSRCKGVTVFRYGCRGEQVLTVGKIPAFAIAGKGARAHAEYAGECRVCSV